MPWWEVVLHFKQTFLGKLTNCSAGAHISAEYAYTAEDALKLCRRWRQIPEASITGIVLRYRSDEEGRGVVEGENATEGCPPGMVAPRRRRPNEYLTLCLKCGMRPQGEGFTWCAECDLPGVNESRKKHGLPDLSMEEYLKTFPAKKGGEP